MHRCGWGGLHGRGRSALRPRRSCAAPCNVGMCVQRCERVEAFRRARFACTLAAASYRVSTRLRLPARPHICQCRPTTEHHPHSNKHQANLKCAPLGSARPVRHAPVRITTSTPMPVHTPHTTHPLRKSSRPSDARSLAFSDTAPPPAASAVPAGAGTTPQLPPRAKHSNSCARCCRSTLSLDSARAANALTSLGSANTAGAPPPPPCAAAAAHTIFVHADSAQAAAACEPWPAVAAARRAAAATMRESSAAPPPLLRPREEPSAATAATGNSPSTHKATCA
eukprot:82259-Chlamydomonas_euryale.AAC.2